MLYWIYQARLPEQHILLECAASTPLPRWSFPFTAKVPDGLFITCTQSQGIVQLASSLPLRIIHGCGVISPRIAMFMISLESSQLQLSNEPGFKTVVRVFAAERSNLPGSASWCCYCLQDYWLETSVCCALRPGWEAVRPMSAVTTFQVKMTFMQSDLVQFWLLGRTGARSCTRALISSRRQLRFSWKFLDLFRVITRFERAYEHTQKYTGCCARGRLPILGVLQLVWDLPWVPLLRWTWNFVIEDL